MISAERRRKTQRKIGRRLKAIKRVGDIGYFQKKGLFEQTNRLAKKHVFGCSRARCRYCSGPKLDDEIRETEI